MKNLFVFFAVLGYKGQPVRRLTIEEPAQREMTVLFSEQKDALLGGNIIEFSGENYKCEPDEIFCAKNFSLDNRDCYENFTALETFRPDRNSDTRIKAIVALDTECRDLMFQSYHSIVTMGARKRSFFYSANSFRKFDTFAFSVGSNLAALCRGENLYFRSVQAIQSFINISEAYQAASNGEIIKLLEHPKLTCDNPDSLLGIVNTKTRKLFSMLSDSPAITDKNLSAEKIGEIAEKNGVLLDVQDGKIVIPSANKGELTAALDFLAENVYTGPLSNERYVTNSKRKME